MDKTYIKRRYMDMRLGNQTISPALQLSNFLMLSYLTINEIIPIWLFAPFFIVGIIGLFTFVGNKFRKVQSSTDHTMNYEKSTDAVKSQVIVANRMEDNCQMIAKHLDFKLNDDPIFIQRLKYMTDISENKL